MTRVLIVEDDALNQKLTRDVLEAHGYESHSIVDGREALEAVIEYQPDLVIMDIGIPGLNGIEATRLLKADPRTDRVPVLAVTAYAMPEDESRMREAGCDAFLAKPVRLQALVALVSELIAGRQGASGSV